jgi:hypothetical protein
MQRSLKLEECTTGVYDRIMDVGMLAEARDGRARFLMRRVLASGNFLIVEIAVKGLGMLNDGDSISALKAAWSDSGQNR